MGKKKQSLQELSTQVEDYFKDLSYTDVRIRFYQRGWALVKQFMLENEIEYYDATVGDTFIRFMLGNRSFSEISTREKEIIRCVNVLTEYQTTGSIKFRSILKSYDFEGEIGELIVSFLDYRRARGLSEDTLNSNKIYLHRFLVYLNSNKILSLSTLDKKHILGFIGTLGLFSKSTIHCTLSSLRGFLRFLADKRYSDCDLSYLVPKSSYKKEARLGLRASDICRLRFENIHWETNTLCLIQKKTKEKVELPLLTEIGNAIIDYLKYGRPESELPYIFIRAGRPYDKLEEPTLHSIVSFYLKRAGIKNIDKKKHGPHALRLSLAGILLEKKTPLPVISEVLGHTNTESTKNYLRIDLESLRQCALDVPPVTSPHFQEVK